MTQNRPDSKLTRRQVLMAVAIGCLISAIAGSIIAARYFQPAASETFEVTQLDCAWGAFGAGVELQAKNISDQPRSLRVDVEYRDLDGRLLAEDSFRIADVEPGDTTVRKDVAIFATSDRTRECRLVSMRVVS